MRFNETTTSSSPSSSSSITSVSCKVSQEDCKYSPYYLLIHNKTLREIPNCFTARRFGYDCRKAVVLDNTSTTTRGFKLGDPLPSLAIVQENLDEYLRIEVLRINSITKNIVNSTELLGEWIWHPSMAKFKNRTLLAARGNEKLYSEVPHFHFIDFIDGKISLTGPLTIDTKSFPWVGIEQVRLVKINEDTIHMSFTHPSPGNAGNPIFNKMQTANLNYNKSRDVFELSKPVSMEKVGERKSLNQKNWVPFLYDENIYFVYNVYPLTIIKLQYDNAKYASTNDRSEEVLQLDTVSSEPCRADMEQPWEYGHIRGGSPAELVNGEYLSFFHSKSGPLDTGTGWALLSYWIGAFTFSPKPPFKMTKISKFPIVKNEWYDGAWFNRGNGYIIYPAGFVVEHIENVTWLLVSFSLQDKTGYMMRIKYDDLMETLMPIDCTVKPNFEFMDTMPSNDIDINSSSNASTGIDANINTSSNNDINIDSGSTSIINASTIISGYHGANLSSLNSNVSFNEIRGNIRSILFIGDSSMQKLQNSSTVMSCPYRNVLRTKGCDWMEVFGIARSSHWNVPNGYDEGPLNQGEDSRWCTECKNCPGSEIYIQNSNQRGCVVQNYIVTDYTKDTEMQSVYANSTQETIAKYLDSKMPNHDVCIMSTGTRDMKLNNMTVDKYVNNVEWFISLMLPICQRGIIWVEMSSRDIGMQQQKILLWNQYVSNMITQRGNDKFRDKVVRLLRVMDESSHSDNTFMTLDWYQRLNSFLLKDILGC